MTEEIESIDDDHLLAGYNPMVIMLPLFIGSRGGGLAGGISAAPREHSYPLSSSVSSSDDKGDDSFIGPGLVHVVDDEEDADSSRSSPLPSDADDSWPLLFQSSTCYHCSFTSANSTSSIVPPPPTATLAAMSTYRNTNQLAALQALNAQLDADDEHKTFISEVQAAVRKGQSGAPQ